jgi:hypothetical protein
MEQVNGILMGKKVLVLSEGACGWVMSDGHVNEKGERIYKVDILEFGEAWYSESDLVIGREPTKKEKKEGEIRREARQRENHSRRVAIVERLRKQFHSRDLTEEEAHLLGYHDVPHANRTFDLYCDYFANPQYY